jgi:hypothetical protein
MHVKYLKFWLASNYTEKSETQGSLVKKQQLETKKKNTE